MRRARSVGVNFASRRCAAAGRLASVRGVRVFVRGPSVAARPSVGGGKSRASFRTSLSVVHGPAAFHAAHLPTFRLRRFSACYRVQVSSKYCSVSFLEDFSSHPLALLTREVQSAAAITAELLTCLCWCVL